MFTFRESVHIYYDAKITKKFTNIEWNVVYWLLLFVKAFDWLITHYVDESAVQFKSR